MPKSVELTPEMRAVLERATIEPRAVILNDAELPRPLYLAIDKAFKALGGKWNGSATAHQFPEGATDRLREAMATGGKVVDQRRTREQFFTPADVARDMAMRLAIRPDLQVREPSAGTGRLVSAALNMGAIVTAVEQDSTCCGAGGPDGKGGLMDLAATAHGQLHIFCADFMSWRPAAALPIDRVMMNPPFSKGQDMAHVRRAFEFLRPGGRLASVMSPHWTFGPDQASEDFRQFVARGDGVAASSWVALPNGSFSAEGTGVNAGMLFLDKK